MLTQKAIIAGILALIVLAVFYVGNQVVRTTPQSHAAGPVQYKVVPLMDEKVSQAVQAATQGKSGTESYVAMLQAMEQAYEGRLNTFGNDGWELVTIFGNSPADDILIFKKY